MVNVTHNYNNGASFLKKAVVVLGCVDDSVLNCNYNLFFNLCTKLCCNDFSSIKVDSLVDACHNAVHKQLLDNLGGCKLKLGSKLTYCDFVTDCNNDGTL